MTQTQAPTQALIIDEPWIGHIMAGRKDWEMRSRPTTKRGTIALVRKGSGQVVATARIVDCLPALSAADMVVHADRHCIPAGMIAQDGYRWFTPWVLADVRVLPTPVPYRHPSGAVTWVDLPSEVQERIAAGGMIAAGGAAPRPMAPRPHTVHPAPQPVRVLSPATAAVTSSQIVPTGIRIPLSGGNLRNGHFSLRPARHLLPLDSIGGSSRAEAGRPVLVIFTPGITVETDIAGDKMILRERGAVRDFYRQMDAAEGDEILLQQTGDRSFGVSLLRKA
ncbi:ASCH domain-containing protein [Croceibacterium mercuriale]|uniref:ASCH domain-containing protein n=1 Tax=Croceibacterium mercuriale TaxID=1572751 RepID=UPI00068DBFE9|nr:ASCH domain-containing protein [Croceibacterium mercuriale]